MAEEVGCGEGGIFYWVEEESRAGGASARPRLGFFLLRETVLRFYSALLFGWRPKK